MSWFVIIQDFFELIACIAGFLFWEKIRHSYWRWFPVYLTVIFLTELVGEYTVYVNNNVDLNVAIYKYWGIPIQFFFFYWLFHKKSIRRRNHRWPLYAAATYFLWLLSDIFSWPGVLYTNISKFRFLATSYAIGTVLLLVLTLMYLVNFVKSEERISFRSDMMFAVAFGLLVFYMLSMPFDMLRTTLYYNYKEIFYIYWHIQYILDYLMYIMFAIAFIYGKVK